MIGYSPMPHFLICSVLLIASILSLGCSGDSDSTDTAATGTAATGTAATGTAATGTAATGTNGPLDFPPVECSGVTCPEKQICVIGGIFCKDTEWVTPKGICAAVPQACWTVSDNEFAECLSTGKCTANSGEDGYFKDGTLTCPPVDLDCF